ncbi:probable tubulin polyglutamylase ttll-15 [Saccostrea echinata]|uniref:probable tubulin polyglutamylase ttll-15 n=1 Tax=Saccostrea echinata TaxID=191078 RepID=UPI002A82BA86|nr:probable tubulin polyglutamylase ttll-15 [Saccostrea echinata]
MNLSSSYHKFQDSSLPVFGKPKPKMKKPGRLFSLVIVVLGLGIVLTLLNIYELHKMRETGVLQQANMPQVEGRTGKYAVRMPVVWIEGKKLESGYLKHVFAVFERIGYVVGDGESDWDVLWSHEYPFEQLAKKISDLKPHQKVNHFPGSGYITNKVSLAVSNNPYIPRAFKIPKEKDKFYQYAEEHPNTLWVQKRNSHRGIKIKHVQELDLSDEGSFVQVFVDQPFLIDGRKFDIGVYTILTSIDPLRVYTLESEALFRFCSQDYYPFDARNINKYVVGDAYMPVWEIPSLKKLYRELNFNFKESFDAYLESQGHNAKKLWRDISAAIKTVYLQKEAAIISSASKYSSSRNFFEMVRFDFALDEDLNVYLMEVNMSPNLSSGHFQENAELYEKVVFNLLSVVLVTRPVKNDFSKSSEDEANMRVSDKDISVFPEWCLSKSCLHSCREEMCKLCSQCVSLTMKKTLKLAYLEHINKGSCGRVLPQKMTKEFALEWSPSTNDPEFQSLNRRNKLMYMWFVGKCRQSAAWC